MDPLSDVLSLLKPRSYVSGGFDVGGELSVQFARHEGIKCYAVVSGEACRPFSNFTKLAFRAARLLARGCDGAWL
jgi:hypothetical protein